MIDIVLGTPQLANTFRERCFSSFPQVRIGMEEAEAASKLQALFRSRRARAQIRTLAKCMIERVFDEGTGCWFYRNLATGEVTWEKPKLLGQDAEFLTPRSRKRLEVQEEKRRLGKLRKAESMTQDEAARFIQGMFRNRVARKHLKALIASVYEKVFDDEGNVFYYNRRTGESSWTKPAFLGSENIHDLQIENSSETKAEEKKDQDEEMPWIPKYKKIHPGEGRAQVKRFLEERKLGHLFERLIDEGFDDMDAIGAMQEVDLEEMGIKRKYRQPLFSAVQEYRVSNNIMDPFFLRKSRGKDDQSEDLYSSGSSSRGDLLIDEDYGPREDEDDEDGDDDEDEESLDDRNSLDIDSFEGDDIPGVEIERIFTGDGKSIPRKGHFALVHYVASFENGTVFESSRKRGRPFEFLVGANHVVPAWDKAIRRLSRGARARLTVMPEMAYGKEGRPPLIPPDAVLKFEIELIDFYYAPVGELIEDEDLSDGDIIFDDEKDPDEELNEL